MEVRAFHGKVVYSFLDDADILGDGLSCDNVVACHHPDRDASGMALLDCVWDLLSRDVSDSDDAEEDYVLLFTLEDSLLVLDLEVIMGC